MDPRAELEELRRIDELERKAAGGKSAPPERKSIAGLGTNLASDVVDTAKGTVQAVIHPWETAKGLVRTGAQAGRIIKGGIQRARDLSPAESQGTAKRLDTTAYDDFADENFRKYGDIGKALNTAYEHPLTPAIAAAQIAVPALRALPGGFKAPIVAGTKAVAGLPGRAVRPAVAAVDRFTTGGRRGTAAAETGRAQATQVYTAAQRRAEAAARSAEGLTDTATIEATRIAERAAGRETRAEMAARVAAQRRAQEAASAAQAEPPLPSLGAVRDKTEQGLNIRTPAVHNMERLEGEMRAEYDAHSAKVAEIAKDLRDKGIGASDGPKGKALVAEIRRRVGTDPIQRKTVSSVLSNKTGGSSYREVLNVLEGEKKIISPGDVTRAEQQGHTVFNGNTAKPYIRFKPDLEAVENLRRNMGDIAHGRKVEGFKGIHASHAKELYEQLSDVVDEYTGGATAGMREAWREGKAKLELHEKTRAGEALVGVQPGTNISSVAASKLPERIIAGGKETIAQAEAIAGAEPVKDMLRSHVQSKLSKLNTSAKVKAATAEGTSLGDVIRYDPELATDVQHHIASLLNAEAHGVQAAKFGERAAAAEKYAENYNKAARALTGEAEKLAGSAAKSATQATKAAKASREYQQKLYALNKAAPNEVVPMYEKMLEDAYSSGKISEAKYTDGKALAAKAAQGFKDEAARKNFIKEGMYAAGVGSMAGLTPLGPLGFIGGAALMSQRHRIGKVIRGARR